MSNYTLEKAIETAIKAEELGIKFYSEMSKRFHNYVEIKEMFELLAKDEYEHKKQFTNLLNQLPASIPSQMDIFVEFLNAVDISKYFQDMESIPNDIKPSEVLSRVYNFEKDTVLFYLGISDFLDDSQIIKEIINVEKKHVTKVMKYILTDGLFRGISDKWE